MEVSVLEKIEKYLPDLTAKQRLIAITILQDPLSISYSSVKSFADSIGVSQASIVRFAQQITNGGFSQLQEELQKHIQSISNPIKRLELNVITGSEDYEILAQVYDTQLNNIRQTFNQNLISSANQACRLITNAEKIYIFGSRGSFAISYYLSHHLNRVLNNTDIVTVDDRLADSVKRITNRDLALFICLPRYSKSLLTVAQKLYSIGTQIVTINGTPRSPFVAFSNVAFYTFYNSSDFHNSQVSSMLVSEMLLSLLISKDVGRALGNLNKTEFLFSDLQQFYSIE